MPETNALTYEAAITALLVVDPYNDFISEGGKLWPLAKEVAEAVGCVPNMRDVLTACRAVGIKIIFVPHHRYRPGDYDDWKHIAPIQRNASRHKFFEAGSWGGEFHPDFQPGPGEVVAQEHWCSSGFANTDLDLQLKKYGLQKVIVIGLRANTCIDSTVRYAVELGYEVTLVRDAIASYTFEQMKSTIEENLPNYASAIVTAQQLVRQLGSR